MKKIVATIRLDRAWPFLAQTAAMVVGFALILALVAYRFGQGQGRLAWLLALAVAVAICARGLFGQIMILRNGLRKDRSALWIKNGRLIHLSPLYESIPADGVRDIESQRLRRGFGLQEYAVISSVGGKKIHLHLTTVNEDIDQLRRELKSPA